MPTIIGTSNSDNITPAYLSSGVTGGRPDEADDSIAGGDGSDQIDGGGGNDTIDGGDKEDYLKGGAGNDSLVGGSSGDRLVGGEGRDTMRGGDHGDRYLVDTLGDLVLEAPDGGRDKVQTTLAAYTLTANVEDLAGLADTGQRLAGNALDNHIIGGAGADTLIGGAGYDILDGGAGADRMIGGAEGNFYYIQGAGDVVVEGLNGGHDRVVSTVAAYTLPPNVEDLLAWNSDLHPSSLPFDFSVPAMRLVGNALNNLIVGGYSADTLVGGNGADTLMGELPYASGVGGQARGAAIADGAFVDDRLLGGGGDDYYLVGDGDVVVEGLDMGRDTVEAGLDHTLAANVEVLVLEGSWALKGTGNRLHNLLIGSAAGNELAGLRGADSLAGRAGADSLLGGEGADTLNGGAGIDVLTGGSGADRFRFDLAADSGPMAADRIADLVFTEGDRIDLRLIDANTLLSGDQAFAWIGGAAFGGLGAASAGQLRVTVSAPGEWRAEGDIDGNGLADLRIDIASAGGPGAGGWFLL
ncbi:calcium-binding protein [Roseomonas sp. CECT 9278]|uniref:calcium-binding protein n=1 Tax=Roseomonas sp. CECT 9278 TaxID=2845823 RepID=UPI001E427A16|nr:calcium-binding protein [Roseomonas sp. CECT 9278]CAH0231322.1 hypothetical protein ROS9278_02658 [Roseomonas sp. CECT 9278]